MAGKVEGARDSRNKEAGMSRQRKIFQILMMTTVILLSVEGCRRNIPGTDEAKTGRENLDQKEQADQRELPDMKEAAGQASMEDPNKGDLSSVREEVLEVGIVADCSNPYAVVVFEQFCQEAKACETPIVVELHDSDSSYDKARQQLEWLAERGIDILLVDVGNTKEQEELGEEIRAMAYPTLYFGLRPEKLEELESSYIGLTGEEQKELEQALEQDQFEESGFRQRAEEDGRKLWERVWEDIRLKFPA